MKRWALLVYFARQDLVQRFTGNGLGLAWALVAPLLQLALFAFVFGFIFKARVRGLDGLGYVAFLSLAMWPWLAFSEGVSRGANALIEHSGLLGKVAVAPWVLICARVMTAFALHGAGFLLVVAVLAVLPNGIALHWLPLVLPAWLGLFALAFAAALLLAVLTVFVRDLQQIIMYGLTALMFLSPILYETSILPEALQGWMAWNPIAGYVHAVREPLLYDNPAPAWPAAALLITGLVAILGAVLYRRIRPYLVDFL